MGQTQTYIFSESSPFYKDVTKEFLDVVYNNSDHCPYKLITIFSSTYTTTLNAEKLKRHSNLKKEKHSDISINSNMKNIVPYEGGGPITTSAGEQSPCRVICNQFEKRLFASNGSINQKHFPSAVFSWAELD